MNHNPEGFVNNLSRDNENYSRTLQQAEKTLATIRQENEKQLYDQKIALQANFTKLSARDISQLNNLNLKAAKEVNEYKVNLQQKYAEQTRKGILSNAEAEKKLQADIFDFIKIKRAQIASQERIENAKLASDKLKGIGNIYFEEKKALAGVYADNLKYTTEILNNRRKLNAAALADIKDQERAKIEEIAELESIYNENKTQANEDNLNRARSELDIIRDKIKLNGKATKAEVKAYKDKLKEQQKEAKKQLASEMRESGASGVEILQAKAEAGNKGAQIANNALKGISNSLNAAANNLKAWFENTIETYAQYQARVNVRLQGSGKTWQGNSGFFGNIFGSDGIEKTIKRALGVNPFVKLQTVMDNVVKATELGIAYNIEQRSFLAALSENIASTFDAFDSSLLRIIRLQQADTTAARLGLEASLTQFFNSYFEDTSYLSNSFDTVSQELIEATSQLGAEQAVAFEYVVQKWLGSLASVGFSDQAVSTIAQAIGQLGSGNVSALSSNATMQNLLVMSASRAGLSYSELLTEGLDASKTNKLMRSIVEYLQQIAESDNKVVKSQYAQIFGMNVSDLKAAENLKDVINNVSSSMLAYKGAVDELYDQMSREVLTSRLSVGHRMSNTLQNSQYGIGTTIASSPTLYTLWKVTTMIEDLTGGINLPTISILGNAVDLNTTVTNLMRAGIVGISSLGLIGDVINGIKSASDPSSMLERLGISRGTIANRRARGAGLSRGAQLLGAVSESVVEGTSSGEDYAASVTKQAEEQREKAKQENAETAVEETVTISDVNQYLTQVFDPKITEIEKMVMLLQRNVTGIDASKVKIDYDTTVKINDDNRKFLENINTNVAAIYTILKDKSIKVDIQNKDTGTFSANGNVGASTF